jgi:hypothetical protein
VVACWARCCSLPTSTSQQGRFPVQATETRTLEDAYRRLLLSSRAAKWWCRCVELWRAGGAAAAANLPTATPCASTATGTRVQKHAALEANISSNTQAPTTANTSNERRWHEQSVGTVYMVIVVVFVVSETCLCRPLQNVCLPAAQEQINGT